MSYPNLCVVDTNVAKTANLATQPDPTSDVPDECVLACIEAIEHVIKKKGVVLDAGDEIFDEYRQQLSMSGSPGMGDCFMKWVHDNRYALPDHQRVEITKNGDSYNEFPQHADLTEFDISDRKFVAVANTHPNKPTILQATDSKWWGWKDALSICNITVQFMCASYIQGKYAEKIGT
ncbi:hypothetical protein PDESU_06098 [Pontiella desulfatans]|uniref:Uncharacterized protein n=1 Tax=Pontiella desulfatans TaxID=2750659 RepID=A0A6C2UBF5_PONDE|nr:hypothetical protein [Pontiella desulfatans]VGO17502.1 hypothetical protein PDESU_06098 [Pontiella desulfatans]